MKIFESTVAFMLGSSRAEVASKEKNADKSWLRIRLAMCFPTFEFPVII